MQEIRWQRDTMLACTAMPLNCKAHNLSFCFFKVVCCKTRGCTLSGAMPAELSHTVCSTDVCTHTHTHTHTLSHTQISACTISPKDGHRTILGRLILYCIHRQTPDAMNTSGGRPLCGLSLLFM